MKALVEGTNAVVFAFADEEAAKRFALRSKRDAPSERHGTIVLKASGENPATVLGKLRDAIKIGKAR
ncbi:MAG: hypothetical protein DRJ42_30360 [Deltaproteobacteria bacterium]|nr:MAG: hypothetical protein DRJ42_30360 [Deltaproteobacteria bacterium]